MERSDAVEIGIAVGSVGLFVVALAFIGTTYGTNGNISGAGALPLIGALTLFVLVMGVAGFYLSRQNS